MIFGLAMLISLVATFVLARDRLSWIIGNVVQAAADRSDTNGYRRGIDNRDAPRHAHMPKTLEVVCTREDCDLDMFQLHYTYSMPDGTGVEAFVCPYCREDAGLKEVRA